MVISIESLTVENLRCFRGEHRLDLGQLEEATMDVVSGKNGRGKTTLADSIQLCLTGTFDNDAPLISYRLAEQLSPGEEISGKVETVISDSGLGRRFRYSRRFKTAATQRGLENSADSLQVQKERDGEWVSIGSSEAVNTVFPEPAFAFSKFDGETFIGIDVRQVGISWSEFVAAVNEAAARQSAARCVELSEFFADNYKLADEITRGINGLLPKLDEQDRYRIEQGKAGLIARRKENGERDIGTLSYRDKCRISLAAALAAADLMPAVPPLIGDAIFGGMVYGNRERAFETLQNAERQVLLFLTEVELEGLDVTPKFELKRTGEHHGAKISSSK